MDEQLSKKEILVGEENVDYKNENPVTKHHIIHETGNQHTQCFSQTSVDGDLTVTESHANNISVGSIPLRPLPTVPIIRSSSLPFLTDYQSEENSPNQTLYMKRQPSSMLYTRGRAEEKQVAFSISPIPLSERTLCKLDNQHSVSPTWHSSSFPDAPEQTNENRDVEITSMDEQLSKKEILVGEENVDNINENPVTKHHTIQETGNQHTQYFSQTSLPFLTDYQSEEISPKQTLQMKRQPSSVLYKRGRTEEKQVALSISPIPLSETTLCKLDNQHSVSPTWHSSSFPDVGIPSEVMHYLEEVDYKPVLSTLNLTTMALLSKAPKTIGLVGRLHFIANLTSFEIGIDSEEGKELRMHASALGENCKRCFTGAKDNFQRIIYSMSDVIEKLSTLTSMMKDDCMTGKESEMVINLITKNVDKCIEFCQKTETMFKHLGEYVKPFDRSLQSAKKKIDDKYHPGSEGKNDWHLNRVKSCLKNISELIEKTSMLFEELGNNWEKITDFFKNMQLFLKGTMKNDIDLYLESLLSVQRVSYGQGTSIMVSMKGNKALQKKLLDILFAKASYVRIVSSFYVFVSSEIFAKCLQIITRSLYVEEQMTPTDIESSMERLQKICTDAEDHVLHLCKSIEQLIKR